MSSIRESFLHGRILGTEDPWTLVRHFQLGMPSLGKPSSLSFWGCHDLVVSRVLSAQSCRVPSGLPSRAIPTSHDPPCLSLLQLWDIRRKGCVFRYRVSMACVGYL